MLVVKGRIPVKAAELPTLLEAAAVMTADTLAEEGCLQYVLAVDAAEPLVIHLFEHWQSEDALDAHFSTDHFRSFSEVLINAADGTADFDRYEVSSTAPLFG